MLATSSAQELAYVEQVRELCSRVVVEPLNLRQGLKNCLAAPMRREPLQAAICRSPAVERALLDLLNSDSFDLVHVEHLRAAHLGTLIPKDIPTVFDSVDCISLLLERTMRASHSRRQRVLAALELLATRAYESRLLNRFDRVAVTSQEDGRALQELAPASEVAVVPNGVDLEYFHPLNGSGEPATLVLWGRMSYHANVTAALHFVKRIFPLIRRICPDVHLRIVGSSPSRMVRALARDPAISVIGFVPDIRAAIGGATVAICPVTVKVGVQNKVLEAMAMGLPVVCTEEGYEGLAATPGQDLLVAASEREFADHVCRLLADPRLRKRVGAAGRRYVEDHHRWDTAARKIETLYSDAVARRAGYGCPDRSYPGPATCHTE